MITLFVAVCLLKCHYAHKTSSDWKCGDTTETRTFSTKIILSNQQLVVV